MIGRFQTPNLGRRIAMASLVVIAIAGLLGLAACKNDKKSTPTPTATSVTGQTPAATEPAGNTPVATEQTGATPSAGGPESPPPVDGEFTQTASGLKILDITNVPGGAVAEAGKMVSVDYTLWLSDGTKIDSSLDRGQPYRFTLSAQPPEVIAGWDEGVVGMTVGSKRRLIIPPDLAYGAAGRGTIPPNAELTFDVELLAVE